MIPLGEATLKVSLLVLCGFACAALMRAQPAALRHKVLLGTFFGVAALPLLLVVAPGWSMEPLTTAFERGRAAGTGVPLEDAIVIRLPAVEISETAGPLIPSSGAGPAVASYRTLGGTLSRWLVPLWTGGVVVGLSILFVGLMRLHRLTRRSTAVADGAWVEAAGELARRYGVRRPVRIVRGAHPAVLVTWGFRRPTILVPPDAVEWTRERIRVVLAHELAHVRRGDWAVQMLAHIVRSIHWFNPLVWIAFRRLVRESEHACDDVVLGEGIDAPGYAGHLLELARASRGARRSWWPAAAMVRRCSLERRVDAMLNPRVDRRPVTRRAAAASVIVMLVLAVPIAGAQLSGGTFHTLSGTIVDPQGRLAPGVTVTLSNAARESTYQVRSDAGGRFEFVGLPSGDYTLRAEGPGFRTFEGSLAVTGDSVRDLQLQVGTVQETITVARSDSPAPTAAAANGHPIDVQALVEECHASAPAGGWLTGGRIRPPLKLKHVSPTYPEALLEEGIGATIHFESRIDGTGYVADLRTSDTTAHPDLVAAAEQAVRQWRFEPTLLNCEPVDVTMRVSITFRPPPPPPPPAPPA